MTVIDVIRSVDERCPNMIEENEKCRELAALEMHLKDLIFDRHVGGENVEYFHYTPGMDLNEAKLAVPDPYGSVYEYCLEMMIHRINGDIDRYNNARILYLDAHSEFSKYWNRTHMPRRAPRFRL